MKIKKISAAIMSATILATSISLSGCGWNTRWAGEINGEKVPVGVYIFAKQLAVGNAMASFAEANPTVKIDDASFKWDNQIIDGKPFFETAEIKAKKLFQNYVAAEMLFDEYDLELDDYDMYISQYQYYYYYTQMKDLWDELGVGAESASAYYNNTAKQKAVFNYVYNPKSESNISPVPQETIDAHFTEDFARYRALKFPYMNESGLFYSDDDVEGFKKEAEVLLKMLKDGAKFTEVKEAYDVYMKELAERKAAEEEEELNGQDPDLITDDDDDEEDTASATTADTSSSETETTANDDTTETTANSTDTDTSAETETDATTPIDTEGEAEDDEDEATKAEEAEKANDVYIKKGETKSSGNEELAPEFVEALFEMNNEEPQIFDTGELVDYKNNAIFVVERLDMAEREDWKDDLTYQILLELKEDDYENYLEEKYTSSNFEIPKDVERKYTAKKMRLEY